MNTISQDFFPVKFEIASISPSFKILDFRQTSRVTGSRDNEVCIVSILESNIGTAEGFKRETPTN